MTVVEFWVEQYNAVVAEKKTLGEKLRETPEENKDLQQQNGVLKKANDTLLSANMDLARKKEHLEDRIRYFKKELDEAEKELVEKIEILNAVQDRLDLKAQLEDLTQRYENTLKDAKKRLDKSIADRSELQADRDIWFRKNCEKRAEIEEFKKALDDAKKQLEELKQGYAEGYSDGNEEGQNELWEMLQLINDVKPFEAPYFEDVTSINDIISWDLEDFKEAYGKWEEEQRKVAEEAKKQHVEYMRDYLTRYCRGMLCINCPLYNSSEPFTSCVFSKLSDEEVEKRYNKVIKSELELKKIPTPVSARLPQPWECTIEGTFEINEEDHELVYGDAVRIPWCDYDYMYIGPEPEATETQARLFDPKNHTVVVTFATNVTYNGGKVILTREGEDDLRKIWKDKK